MSKTLIHRLACALPILACLSFQAAGADFEDDWFKVTGNWDGMELRADQIQLRDPEKALDNGQVSGQIKQLDPRAHTMVIGPFLIDWSEVEKYQKIDQDELADGVSIRVSGTLSGPGRLSAKTIALETRFYGRSTISVAGLTGKTTHRPDGTHCFSILGIPIYATQNGYNVFKSLTRRQDARRPDDQFKIDLFGTPLTIGGQYTMVPSYRDNYDLDSKDNDDFVRYDHTLKTELFYPFSKFGAIFLSFNSIVGSRFNIEDDEPDTVRPELERDETWIYFDRLFGSGAGLQIGNQNHSETREWWWDRDLDSVRLYYDKESLHFELSSGKQLGSESTIRRIRPQDLDVVRVMGLASWMWKAKQRLELFFMRQWDGSSVQHIDDIVRSTHWDPSDGNLTWFGARAIGEQSLGDAGGLLYWLDTAGVVGNEQVYSYETVGNHSRQVSGANHSEVAGWAFDTGASWILPLWLEPTITLSYARASGDSDPSDGHDGAFRQTGLQSNKWRFHGVNRFRYYGELLRPELSNLAIGTAALGVRLLQNSSIELVYHKYDQVNPATFIRDSRLNDDPNGISRDIGQELDIVMNFREWKQLELGFTGSMFDAGKAFGSQSGERAFFFAFDLIYTF